MSKKNKNKKIFISVFFLIFTLNFFIITNSFANNYNAYDYLRFNYSSTIEFEIDLNQNYNIDYFNVDFYLFPQNDAENIFINNFISNPTNYSILGTSQNKYLQFNLNQENIKEKNKIEKFFIVESLKYHPKVKNIENYPILKTNKEEYLQFSGLIDTDDNIKNQASLLAQGLDDVFLISASIAKWIREDINYDLSTVLENPNQKATQVFQSKVGVCKEITNLYVSMLRSLGIPARVVSGFAYTNSQKIIDFIGTPWGGHAWAEVYIDNQWIPFDLTYDQYGFVDATHIPTYKGLEVKTQASLLNSRGYGFSLKENSLKTNYTFSVLEKTNLNKEENYEIKISGPMQLAPNSFGYLELEINNIKDFYQVIFLNINKPEEVTLNDLNHKMVILKPYENKTVFFRYQLPDFEKGYIYNVPIIIFNEEFREEILIEVKEDNLLIEELETPKDDSINGKNSNLIPQTSCNFIMEENENLLLCSIHNQNNFPLNNFEICTNEKNCKELNLRINEKQTFVFSTEKFNETLYYIFQEEKYFFNFNIEKPKLETEITFINQRGYINTKIENYLENMYINVYINDKFFQKIENKNNSLELILLEGEYNIKTELVYRNRILDSFEEKIITTKPKIGEQIKTFFSKLFDSFTFLFFS